MSYETLAARRDEIDTEIAEKQADRDGLVRPDRAAFDNAAQFELAVLMYNDALTELDADISALSAERVTVNEDIADALDQTNTVKKSVNGDYWPLTAEELADYTARVAAHEAAEPERQAERVNGIRDAKIAGGFSFAEASFQTDPESVKRIAGAASAAHVAITLNGAQADDLRWADPDSDFEWIAADNSLVPMDAPTTIAFGQAYMTFERTLVFVASAIKAEIRAGTYDGDPAEDPRWPS